MSIKKQITTLPDTRRNFDSEINSFGIISGIFVSKKSVLFSSIEAFQDIDEWMALLASGDLIPLHYVQEFEPQDEETQYNESQQDFSYKLRDGRYRYKLKYNWTIDRHQLVTQLSGTDLYIYSYDRNRNIYGTSDDGTTVRGFSTNHIELEKLLFTDPATPVFSPLDIELRDSTELNNRGIVKRVDWQPTDINRLFASINVEFINSDTLNFSISYLGQEVNSVNSSDVAVTDNKYGALTFSLFNYLGGVYQLSGFNNPLTAGKLEVLSSLYLGCTKYHYTIVVVVENNFVFEDGDNFVFEDGNNLIFEN